MLWYGHEIDHHSLSHEENGYALLWKPQQLTSHADAVHATQKLLLPPAQDEPSFLPLFLQLEHLCCSYGLLAECCTYCGSAVQ
uniref:Uncharacterized protein n=1 Tax=Arundo donax TaxID=35708 RepID=A0A0A9D888_ARUDO